MWRRPAFIAFWTLGLLPFTFYAMIILLLILRDAGVLVSANTMFSQIVLAFLAAMPFGLAIFMFRLGLQGRLPGTRRRSQRE